MMTDIGLAALPTPIATALGFYVITDPAFGANTASTDNRAAIQAAIDAAAAAGGGAVFIPNGTFVCAAAAGAPAGSMILEMKTNVRLTGNGRSSILKWANGLSANIAYGISCQSGVWGVTLDNFRIHGNSQNNTTNTIAIYLYAASGFQPGPFTDAYGSGLMASGILSIVDNVLVTYSRGGGISVGQYYSCTLVSNCIVYGARGFGISVYDDQHVINCIVGFVTDDGTFNATGLIANGQCHVTNVKCYGSGLHNHPSGAFNVLNGGGSLVNCEAQECPGNGYVVSNALGAHLIACRADAVADAGAYVTGTSGSCEIDLICGGLTLPSGTYTPTYGIYCDASGSGNDLKLIKKSTIGTADVGGTTLANQTVRRNNAGTVTTPTVTSGAAFTPGATQDTDVHVQLAAGSAGSVTVTMGPSTGAENTVINALAVASGAPPVIRLRVPCAWKVVVSVTTVTIAQTTVVTC